MQHLWLILLVAAGMVRESVLSLAGGGVGSGEGAGGVVGWLTLPTWMAAAVEVGAMVWIALMVHAVVRWHARRLERTGSGFAAMQAERAARWGRGVIVGVHVLMVLVFGWQDAVRSVVGNVVLVDEVLTLLPAACAYAAGWWSLHPVERLLREAVLLRTLDEGRSVYAIPGVGAYVWSNVRHQMLLTLVPLALVVGWSEIVDRGMAWVSRGGWDGAGWIGWLVMLAREPGSAEAVRSVAQVLGVIVMFVTAPLVLKVVWDTVPLGAGEVRERLTRMCKNEGVGVRDLLVWRTHGTMINGAVMGLLGRVRFVLLTDALLDALPTEQVEAVMAHELAHVRRGHMLWLAGVIVATVGLVWVIGAGAALGTDAALSAVFGPMNSGRVEGEVTLLAAMVEGLVTIGGLVGAIFVFGCVSRRFEWQADAFAVAYLSGQVARLSRDESASGNASAATAPAGDPAGSQRSVGVVTPGAAQAMAGALDAVARLNHVDRRRRSWRHGSIADRQARIRALVGLPISDFPIDRTVRRIKRWTAVGLAMCGVAMLLG